MIALAIGFSAPARLLQVAPSGEGGQVEVVPSAPGAAVQTADVVALVAQRSAASITAHHCIYPKDAGSCVLPSMSCRDNCRRKI